MKTEVSLDLLSNYIVTLFVFEDYEIRKSVTNRLLNICYKEMEQPNPQVSITHLAYIARGSALKDDAGFTCYNTDAMKDLVVTLYRQQIKAGDYSTDLIGLADDIMRTVFLAELDKYIPSEKNNNTIAECYAELDKEIHKPINNA